MILSFKYRVPSIDHLICNHTQIWTWAIVSSFIWITYLSCSHALVHLPLVFLKLVLNHRVILALVPIRRLVLPLMRFICRCIVRYISLFLFTHWALNKLLHLNDASVSIATMLRKVSCTSWLQHLLILIILSTLICVELILILNNDHFV